MTYLFPLLACLGPISLLPENRQKRSHTTDKLIFCDSQYVDLTMHLYKHGLQLRMGVGGGLNAGIHTIRFLERSRYGYCRETQNSNAITYVIISY